MTVHSKEENSQNFCPNYVQEFGLWSVSGSGFNVFGSANWYKLFAH